jgi:hypothetical protein
MDKTYNQRDGYLTEQLFVWQKIHDYDVSEILREKLRQELKWDWLKKLKLEKLMMKVESR